MSMADPRETFLYTLIVVTGPDGTEVEIDPQDMMGDLDDEASSSLRIGMVVRKMLLTAREGEPVTVTVYDQ